MLGKRQWLAIPAARRLPSLPPLSVGAHHFFHSAFFVFPPAQFTPFTTRNNDDRTKDQGATYRPLVLTDIDDRNRKSKMRW